MTASHRYLSKAIPGEESGTWHGQFSWPGQEPHFVRNRDGSKRVFTTTEDAIYTAKIAGWDKLEERFQPTSRSAPERYKKLSGGKLEKLRAEAGLTPTFAAFLYGVSLERYREFCEEIKPVPHGLHLMLVLLKFFGEPATDIAEKLANDYTEKRVTRKEPTP